jgi:hypothetical protein
MEFVEIVTDYLEAALPPDEKALFEAHIARCQGCKIFLQQIKQTIRWTGNLTEEQLTGEAKEKLLQNFRDWSTSQRLGP